MYLSKQALLLLCIVPIGNIVLTSCLFFYLRKTKKAILSISQRMEKSNSIFAKAFDKVSSDGDKNLALVEKLDRKIHIIGDMVENISGDMPN